MNKKFIFVGNRSNVLNAMIERRLNIVSILAVEGSFLEKELIKKKIKHKTFKTKNELLNFIKQIEFDVLVSNGCPYILPISKIKKKNQMFINVHPSLLPDLRGGSPINGAILFDRNAGAACHLMDDGIDTGSIISRINLGKYQDLGLLYQLSFIAEGKVFIDAYNKNFKILQNPVNILNPIYYSCKDKDLVINFDEDINMIVRRIKAFGIKSQGAYFIHKNHKITVLNAVVLKSQFLENQFKGTENGSIVLKYEDGIVIKLKDGLLLLTNIVSGYDYLNVGQCLL